MKTASVLIILILFSCNRGEDKKKEEKTVRQERTEIVGNPNERIIKVLVSDEDNLLQGSVSNKNQIISYHFNDSNLESDQFNLSKDYQEFDAFVKVQYNMGINEVSISYRDAISQVLLDGLKIDMETRVGQLKDSILKRNSIKNAESILPYIVKPNFRYNCLNCVDFSEKCINDEYDCDCYAKKVKEHFKTDEAYLKYYETHENWV